MNIFLKIIGIFLFLGVIGLGIFIFMKSKNTEPVSPASEPVGVLPYNSSINDEKEIKSLAENFINIQGSYQLGSFVALREAQSMMTKRYQEETTKYIENGESFFSKKPKEYITYTSMPTDIKITYLDAKKAEITTIVDFSTVFGAYIYLDGNLVQVDRAGKKTTEPLKKEFRKKNVVLSIIRENNLWKVDKITAE